MTQEEKQLRFKDLCARLQYGVICCVTHKKNGSLVKEDMKLSGIFENGNLYFLDELGSTYSDDYISYLRPISSMTEEEKKELSKKYVWDIQCGQIRIRYHSQGCWDDDTECPTEEYIILFDWLNARRFDYRGLIEKGLALEATTDMYNN